MFSLFLLVFFSHYFLLFVTSLLVTLVSVSHFMFFPPQPSSLSLPLLYPLSLPSFPALVNADMADAIPIRIHPVHEVLASVSLPELLWIYNICSKAKSGRFLKSHQSSGCIAVWHTQFYFATRMLFWMFLARCRQCFLYFASTSFIFSPGFVCSAVFQSPSVSFAPSLPLTHPPN